MNTDRKDSERIATVKQEMEKREEIIERALKDRAAGPLPGDLYSFAHDVEATVLWAVMKPHPDGDDLHLVLPADTNPLKGSADVRVPDKAMCGPLTIRCDRAQWLPTEGFALGSRVGFLEDIYIALANNILARLATGQKLPDDEGQARQIDWAPEYRHWIRTVATASQRVRDTVEKHAATREDQAEVVVRSLQNDRASADPIVGILSSMIRDGKTPRQAMKDLILGGMGEAKVRAALAQYEKLSGRIRRLKEPATLLRDEIGDSWYIGPQPSDVCWPALEDYLRHTKKWTNRAIADVDLASTKILSLLAPAGLAAFNRRGLVVGYVQSGKTANFTALIAKAADAGYRLFIVLSGLTKSLRAQTQRRLQHELTNLKPDLWHSLTSLSDDFWQQGNVNAFLSEHAGQRTLCVMKKNARIFERLLDWLGNANSEALRNCPVLVIDDEADQASLNASGNDYTRTAINSRILDLLRRLPRVGYVGFTATPYANVFIDPTIAEDLYPRDFIVDLPRSPDYFGPERIFGRARLNEDEPDFDGLDMIRHVPEQEVPRLKSKGRNDRMTFQPEITESLETSLRYYLMACSCRMARGHLTSSSEPTQRHASMLIHTTLYTEVHNKFKPRVEKFLKEFTESLKSGDRAFLRALKAEWQDEIRRVPPADGKATPFSEVVKHLKKCVSMCKVVVENSRSEIRLEYGDEPGVQIVIGGNSLSRGLTLEGLVVSYFVRASTAYDTLLQMGRWFGYRPGYSDLPRIWMTEELDGYFYDLATVDQEIRNDIKRYELEGITPLDFAVRVRTHPALSISSRLKMGKATDCWVSYAGRRVQTILFEHRNAQWLAKNIAAGKKLVANMKSQSAPMDVIGGRFWRFKDVPVTNVLQFLRDYQFHVNSVELKADLIGDYIEGQNGENALKLWNVVIVGRRPGANIRTLDLGHGVQVPVLERSRLLRPGSDANIGVLMTAEDAVVDLDIPPERLAGLGEPERMRLRDELPYTERRGLLLLYPIARDSKPRETEKVSKRVPLDAVENALGVAFVFPGVPKLKDTPAKYKSVDLSHIEREVVDELEELDEADQ